MLAVMTTAKKKMIKPHTSLIAGAVGRPVLLPRREMEPNEKCWCLSGKKWKKCHKLREHEPELSWEQFKEAADQPLIEGICLYPMAPAGCAPKIIRAHTVQKGGGLKHIAESGKVLSPKDEILRLSRPEKGKIAAEEVFENKAPFNPLPVGIKDASVFLGFCANHDGPLFAPVENRPTWPPTKMNAFLLSFRAIAYELFAKVRQQESNEVTRQTLDRGLPFENQARIQQGLFEQKIGHEMGVRDTKAWKLAFDTAYKTSHYTDYHFALLEVQPILPIVACGGWHLDFDFTGHRLQRLGQKTSDYRHMTLNITATPDRSIVVLGWMGPAEGPEVDFVESFLAMPHQEKTDAIFRMCFEYVENVYLRPSWWSGLSVDFQRAVKDRIFGFTQLAPGRKQDCLKDDGLRYFSSAVATSTGLVL
jgi:SEC-C motif